MGGHNSIDSEIRYPKNLSPANLTRVSKFNVTIEFYDGTLEDSFIVGMNIRIARLSSSYMMEYYLPCIGIILLSEIGFVVPVTAIPGRIGLLVTQFLTLMNLFIHQMVIYFNNLFYL